MSWISSVTPPYSGFISYYDEEVETHPIYGWTSRTTYEFKATPDPPESYRFVKWQTRYAHYIKVGSTTTETIDSNYTDRGSSNPNRFETYKVEVWEAGGSHQPQQWSSLYEIRAVFESYTPTTYTITWDGNGGTPNTQTTQSQTGSGGQVVGSFPTQPTRANYDFDDWWTEASDGTQVTTSTAVSSDVTFYAHWTPVAPTTYTIRFDENWSGGIVHTEYISAGDSLNGHIPSDPTRVEGGITYTFLGWWTAPSGGTQVSESTVPSGDTTYYAQWYSSKWNINFVARYNGNTVELEYNSRIVDANGTISHLPHTSNNAIPYVGAWYDEWNNLINQNTTVQYNGQTYHAECQIIVPLVFDKKGGSGGDNSVTVNIGQLNSSPVRIPTKSDYRFLGYYDENYGEEYFDGTGAQIAIWWHKLNLYPNDGEQYISQYTLSARWLKANILLRNQGGKLIRVNGSLVHG